MSMSEERRTVLRAVCDTVVPSIERAEDPDGFWARSASDVGAPEALEQVIELMPPFQREGLAQMLDGLGEIGFAAASQRSREQLLQNLNALGPAVAAGVSALARPDPLPRLRRSRSADRTEPVLAQLRLSRPGRSASGRRAEVDHAAGARGRRLALEADVCVVGSGAGAG